MSTGILGVHAVIVVSLHSRPDRLAAVRRQLDAQEIAFEVFDAFDAVALRLLTDVRSSLLRSGRNPNGVLPAGRIGAFLSKAALFRECHRRRLGNVLVLEDDVRLAPDFAARLANAVAVLPADWDTLYCGCWDWDPASSQPIATSIIRPGRAQLTHAVLYAEKAFDWLVAETRQMTETMDITLATQINPNLNVYAVEPQIAWQRDPTDSHGL